MKECNCFKCIKERDLKEGKKFFPSRMPSCQICHNKRCPKATDHNLECTNSNEPGQKGSIYA